MRSARETGFCITAASILRWEAGIDTPAFAHRRSTPAASDSRINEDTPGGADDSVRSDRLAGTDQLDGDIGQTLDELVGCGLVQHEFTEVDGADEFGELL